MPSLRTSRSNRRRLTNEINVVPYIDVMLVLLVIFMVTAPMITPGLINLPSVGQASEIDAKPLEVQIKEDGEIALRMREGGAEFETVSEDQLVSEIQSMAESNTPVVIAADGRVPYEKVVKIMDELRAGGVERLGLLVNQGSESADN